MRKNIVISTKGEDPDTTKAANKYIRKVSRLHLKELLKKDKLIVPDKDELLKNWEEELQLANAYGEEYKIDMLVGQAIVDANKIHIPDAARLNEVEFPWHGYTYSHFESLNSRLVEALPFLENCQKEADVRMFKCKYYDIYTQYLKRPIRCHQLNNQEYEFDCDGRHRIVIAQINSNNIPIVITELVNPHQISFEEYMERYIPDEWVFLNKNEL